MAKLKDLAQEAEQLSSGHRLCPGCGGPVNGDVRAALCGVHPTPIMSNYIYGLGGKPIDLEHIANVYDDPKEAIIMGHPKRRVGYLNLKEGERPALV